MSHENQPQLEVMGGSPGVLLEDIAHVIVPGRGRTADGMAADPRGLARAGYGTVVYYGCPLIVRMNNTLASQRPILWWTML